MSDKPTELIAGFGLVRGAIRQPTMELRIIASNFGEWQHLQQRWQNDDGTSEWVNVPVHYGPPGDPTA